MSRDKLDSAHSQMSAVVGKLMDALEQMAFIQEKLHPLEFHEIRSTIIPKVWEAYTIGLRAGRADNVHTS